MKGSQKQKRWATDIKNELIPQVRDLWKSNHPYESGALCPPEEFLKMIDNAEWWINNKNLTAEDLMANAEEYMEQANNPER